MTGDGLVLMGIRVGLIVRFVLEGVLLGCFEVEVGLGLLALRGGIDAVI